MERTNEILIQIIANEVCNKQLDLPLDIMADEQFVIDLFETARKHNVTHIVASNLNKSKLLSGSASQAFESQLYGMVFRNEKMNYVLESVYNVLENNEIPYIPLKGAVLKNLYPEPWMRTSTDIDILVREQDLNLALQAISNALECRQINQSSHDVTLETDSNIFIELHFRLIDEDFKSIATKILNNVWNYAKPCNQNSFRHEIDHSFFYFYHISHMAKHIIQGGCGIRPFLDLWLMNCNHNYTDERTRQMLRDGSLLNFAECAEQLSQVWFAGAKHTQTTEMLQDYIVKGGMFGSKETRMLSGQQHHGGKRKHILKRIFVSRKDLAYTYPIVKKYRFLTPLCEICRLISLLFGKKKKFRKAYLTDLNNVSSAHADEIKILFESIEL